MADGRKRPHIGGVQRFSSQLPYSGKGGGEWVSETRNRAQHGARIRQQLETVREQFHLSNEVEPPSGILRDDAVYVEIVSAWGTILKFEQLHQASEKGDYVLLSTTLEENPEAVGQYRAKAVVVLTEGGISHFMKKVQLYLTENTKDKAGNLTDKPKANDLIANIEAIQLATLQAFWKDGPEYPFPQPDEVVWWEVWFRRTTDSRSIQNALDNLHTIGAQIGVSKLEFPEHIVRLVKASANQLSQSLLLLDSLSELRKPQETADFILRSDDAQEWSADMLSRIDNMSAPDSVLICLLDSGVNHLHPLLVDFLPESNMYTWNDAWGKDDGARYGGHGTGMAGLALYGDMVDALASSGRIQIYHALESFKLISSISNTDPELYGHLYERGCAEPIIDRPNNLRVFCLSVTNEHFAFNGRPSVHSAALDKIAFGNAGESREPQLLLVSGGNVVLDSASDFPDKNFRESVQDPAQAFNVLTVGSYTRKDRIDAEVWPGWQPLSTYGEMAPSNSTSGAWETRWPNKPDIVMEGGNLAHHDGEVDYKDSLQLVTTHKDHRTKLFQPFGDTSAAVALASKLAAELRTEYPAYWPETIRGLMVHSAEWTEAMLRGRDMKYEANRRAVLRSVGYGVPIAEKARYSGSSLLTLVAEREIQPFIGIGSAAPKFNEYHLYELPWPTEVLAGELAEREVTLKVTLSYFIEPNPGDRRYASQFRYQSHELDFRIIKPTEPLEVFKNRISRIAQEDEEITEEAAELDRSAEKWSLGRVRSRGSVRKDFIKTTGANLASQNKIAVYPKGGWYKTRKKLNKFNTRVRYSLIVSIETEEVGVDIYTPVAVEVGVPIAAR